MTKTVKPYFECGAKPELRCDDGREWELLAPVIFNASGLDRVNVANGYHTDLASVPRIFWWLFPPQGAGKHLNYAAAAIVHDYIYQFKIYPRQRCDEIFLEAMVALDVRWWARNLIWSQVRLWGWIVYNKGGKRQRVYFAISKHDKTSNDVPFAMRRS